jgi:GTP-binding protein Era
VTTSLADVDATVLVVEAGKLAPADRAVIGLLPPAGRVIAALNKVDRLADKNVLLPQMAELGRCYPFAAIVPVSAETGLALDRLLAEVRAALPVQPRAFDADALTDRDERFLAAEFVREKIFRSRARKCPTRRAWPSTSSSTTGRCGASTSPFLVDRESQRAILLGEGGSRMKAVATQARADMERLFGGRVFLEVWVRVKRGWADDDRMLERLGY